MFQSDISNNLSDVHVTSPEMTMFIVTAVRTHLKGPFISGKNVARNRKAWFIPTKIYRVIPGDHKFHAQCSENFKFHTEFMTICIQVCVLLVNCVMVEVLYMSAIKDCQSMRQNHK
jgi:hypothetical protein